MLTSTLSKNDIDELTNFCQRNDFYVINPLETSYTSDGDIQLRLDYSGRGMYGDTCIGVVGDISGFAIFMSVLTDWFNSEEMVGAGRQDEIALWYSVCQDSMGQESIYYFPHVKFAGQEQVVSADETELTTV